MIRFLRQLSKESPKLSDSADQTVLVDSSEQVSRYIFTDRHIRPSNNSVRYAAFLPHNLETSVFRTSNLSEPEIWFIGTDFVGKQSGRTLKARADLNVASVSSRTAERLRVVAETSRHHLHANIVGWPAEKDAQINLALQLASVAAVRLPP